MSTNSKAIIPAITGIRAVAAGMVFFYHWFFHYVETLPLLIRAPFEVGYVGVPIFFALSGFLIVVRYADDLATGRVGYGRYLWKRFARIYPLYLFILTFLVLAFGRPVQVVPTDFRGIFRQLHHDPGVVSQPAAHLHHHRLDADHRSHVLHHCPFSHPLAAAG